MPGYSVTLRIGIANARSRSRTYSSTLAPFPGRAVSAIAAIRSGTSTMAGPKSITAASRDTGAFRYTNQRTGRPSTNRRRNSCVFSPRQISS